MSVVEDAEGDAARTTFAALLAAMQARSRTIAFWWRDDDAETVTPELHRLLIMAERFALPLGLAVVPKDASAALADRLSRERCVWVLQHGWQHKAHNEAGAKASEFGDSRPRDAAVDELKLGRDRLRSLFGARFAPVFVPPWNRIGDDVIAELGDAGISGLSIFGRRRCGVENEVNTHLDIFDWRPTRRPIARAKAYAILSREIEDRLQGSSEPIGILTHHLVHENASWILLEELLGLLTNHPAVSWPTIPELFSMDRS